MNTKKDLRNFILLVMFYICAVMLSAFLAFGCSATRLHEKAVKKGYVHAIHVDTLKVPYVDTLVITKGDSIIYEQVIKYRDSLVFNTLIEYKPKWRTRFDNKRFADSSAHIRAMYSDSLKNARKTQKIVVKNEGRQIRKSESKLHVFFTGLGLGLILVDIVYILSKLTKFLV